MASLTICSDVFRLLLMPSHASSKMTCKLSQLLVGLHHLSRSSVVSQQHPKAAIVDSEEIVQHILSTGAITTTVQLDFFIQTCDGRRCFPYCIWFNIRATQLQANWDL